MVLSIIFLEDKHKIVLHLSIFDEYQQFFQHRICFSIQPSDYSDPWPRLARSGSFFLILLFNKTTYIYCWELRLNGSCQPRYLVFSGVLVQSLMFCVVYCRSQFVRLSLFASLLSVHLQFTACDYIVPFWHRHN